MTYPQRFDVMVQKDKYRRTTVYFSPDVYSALRLLSAQTGASVSQLVNDELQKALSLDAADLDAFVIQKEEPTMPFESFICGLRRRGRI